MKTLVIPVLTAVMVTVVMCFQAVTPAPLICEAPAAALGEIPGFSSEPLEISEAERTILPSDTHIDKRLYKAPSGHWYQVSLVIGGTSKSSIHRPELCLPAQGFLMTSPRTVEISGRQWRLITLDGGLERPSLGFAYTFFNQDGEKTASHTARIFRDVWDRSVLNRADRWVMVTVNSSAAGDGPLVAIAEMLKGLLP